MRKMLGFVQVSFGTETRVSELFPRLARHCAHLLNSDQADAAQTAWGGLAMHVLHSCLPPHMAHIPRIQK